MNYPLIKVMISVMFISFPFLRILKPYLRRLFRFEDKPMDSDSIHFEDKAVSIRHCLRAV